MSNNKYNHVVFILGLPCTIIEEFSESPPHLSKYTKTGQCYHVANMVKDYANFTDPTNYNRLVGIVGRGYTAQQTCKRKSKSSQATVDPDNPHRPWCNCKAMFFGGGSPWKGFLSCASNTPPITRFERDIDQLNKLKLIYFIFL